MTNIFRKRYQGDLEPTPTTDFQKGLALLISILLLVLCAVLFCRNYKPAADDPQSFSEAAVNIQASMTIAKPRTINKYDDEIL